MNSDYCSCTEFEKAVDYNDIRYYRPEDDSPMIYRRMIVDAINNKIRTVYDDDDYG